LVDDESDSSDVKVERALINGLTNITGKEYERDDSKVNNNTFAISSSEKVGASIADDIKNASMESVALSLVVIFLYIVIRFRRWQFGLGAIIALFHDTLAVLSCYAIAEALGFSFEIDQVFIAAILTVIGYSINDTVIVFDRIRETLGLKTSSDIEKTVNSAINNTLSRTMITSLTTLLVITVLLLFGGEVLRGFSFSLFVGIVIGTYSSIFIASPIVVDLQKRKLSKAPATS
jgi:SecD/SecF fusion protein